MKKLISTLLTIAMLLSLIPAAFATETTTLEKSGVKIVYDLSSIIVDNKLEYSTGSNSIAGIDYEMTNGFFAFSGGTSVSTSGKLYIRKKDNVGAFLAMSSGASVSFEIFVPKAGVYDFEMYAPETGYVNSSNANNIISAKNTVMNVDLIKNGVSVAKGSYTSWKESEDTSDSYVVAASPKVISGIEISEAGKYTITFKPTNKNWTYQTVGTFVLNGGDDLVPMMSSVTIDENKIYVDNTAKITATASLMSDAKTPVEGVTYTYASSDEKVATVDASGKVTGTGMGTATITATVTKNGYSSSGTVDITVNSLNASGVTAVYDIVKGARDSVFSWNNPQWYLEGIGYDDTMGFWKYHSAGAGSAHHRINSAYGVLISGTSEYVAIEINVPESGDYNVDFTYGQTSDGGIGAIWILPGDTVDIDNAIASQNALAKDINYYNATLTTDHRNLGTVNLKKGKNLVVYKYVSGGRYQYMLPGRITLNGGNSSAYTGVVSVEDAVLEEKETTTATANVFSSANSSFNSSGYTVFDKITDYTFTSSNPDVATVAADGKVTAHKAGTAIISATCTNPSVGNVIGAEITVNTPEYTTAFGTGAYTSDLLDETVNLAPQVKALTYAKDGNLSGITATATKKADDTYNVSVEGTPEGYTFRYWVRGLEDPSEGNKRIVSLNQSFTYSPEKGDANYLIAVYTKDGEVTTPEYFNANGQLLPEANEDSYPVMPGYGRATGWKEPISGIKEAVYGNVQSYAITVNGETKSYNYGEAVSCIAPAEKDGQHFLGWTKKRDGETEAELVSADLTYTFYAWEKCTVVPVYVDNKPVFAGEKRKILVDTFDIDGETAIMAEFIGFDDAIERGITIDGTDYAMTNKAATQFTLIAESADTNISAYAILADRTKLIYNK